MRVSFAGGGTDLVVYSEVFGGQVLSATINKYARVTIVPRTDDIIVLHSTDLDRRIEVPAMPHLHIDGVLDLLKAVYNRVVRDHNSSAPLSFELTSHSEAPAGSGIGSSSALVVAVLGAFTQWLNLPLSKYEIARLAIAIERQDLALAGGKQDQYASTFGGWNSIEFLSNENVIVNPLQIKASHLRDLESSIVLYFTGISRFSPHIIERQVANIRDNPDHSIVMLHQIKRQVIQMKQALLEGPLDQIGPLLHVGWHSKKQTASDISNNLVEELYRAALRAGSTGGKICGAGGGGYMMLYCPGNTRYAVIDALRPFGGEVHPIKFESEGLVTWDEK